MPHQGFRWAGNKFADYYKEEIQSEERDLPALVVANVRDYIHSCVSTLDLPSQAPRVPLTSPRSEKCTFLVVIVVRFFDW